MCWLAMVVTLEPNANIQHFFSHLTEYVCRGKFKSDQLINILVENLENAFLKLFATLSSLPTRHNLPHMKGKSPVT